MGTPTEGDVRIAYARNAADGHEDRAFWDARFNAFMQEVRATAQPTETNPHRSEPSGSPIERLHEIVRGIDRCEVESAVGWWETSAGAEFGAAKLAELEALIRSIA